MSTVEDRFTDKYPEGQINYTLAADQRTTIITALGYVGIGNLCDSLRNSLPSEPDHKAKLVETIKNTSEDIALLFIYGGAITNKGKIILPEVITGSKPHFRLSPSTYIIDRSSAHILSYWFPPRHHGRPFFYMGDQPMDYGIHNALRMSFEKTVSKLSTGDNIKFPVSGMVSQNLMTLARVHGQGIITPSHSTNRA